jgi:hypothetical protein
MMPKAARERFAKPRAGAASRSANQDRIRNAPLGVSGILWLVTEMVTIVKRRDFISD